MSRPGVPAVGDRVVDAVVRGVRDDDIQAMALVLRDPNPIHFDLAAVARAGLGDRAVNQGGSTMAYVADHVVAWAGGRRALRSIDCSFRGSVSAGDDVEVGAVVTSVEQVADGAEVELEVWADVVGGRRAIAGVARVVLAGESA
ncbi:MaoC family dehydratase [Nocardioides zeae]|uniref:MaoC family dehydratase n=1 Tax=Nocardioides imazamoxiresistens TaxID=3231893 RepID=A0ABU3PTQ2_9ACTN|nr:MaoC family dehydratase [Nocardioides zeae]MDT9592185.1 MaoC family dehydratase [Nocardioides zeae]